VNLHKAQHAPKADPRKFNPFAKKPKAREASPEELKRLFGKDWQKYV